MTSEYEQTLDEYVRSLPPGHRALQEYDHLKIRLTILDRVERAMSDLAGIDRDFERGRR